MHGGGRVSIRASRYSTSMSARFALLDRREARFALLGQQVRGSSQWHADRQGVPAAPFLVLE